MEPITVADIGRSTDEYVDRMLQRHRGASWLEKHLGGTEEPYDQWCRRVAGQYSAELVRLLIRAEPEQAESRAFLRRLAGYLINQYALVGSYLDPDEACTLAWTRIVEEGRLLTFREQGSFEGWVKAVLAAAIREEHKRIKRTIGPDLETVEEDVEAVTGDGANNDDDSHARALVLEVFHSLVRTARQDTGAVVDRPSYERAWILWNDSIVDLYAGNAERLPRPANREAALAAVAGSLGAATAPPFPYPPPEVPAPNPGEYQPEFSSYLSWGLGVIRGWDDQKIREDLARPASPKDLSCLRSAVRSRRHEVRARLKGALESGGYKSPTKGASSPSQVDKEPPDNGRRQS